MFSLLWKSSLLLVALLITSRKTTVAFSKIPLPVSFASKPCNYLKNARSYHPSLATSATVAPDESTTDLAPGSPTILKYMADVADEAKQYAEVFGMSSSEAGFYAIFAAMKKAKISLGLKGKPFVLRRKEILEALKMQEAPFDEFFTMNDFAKAVEDDFLDAARGSTDNRRGWKITDVSVPRGDSFEEARMTFQDVEAALDKGTVILNAAGAHIPKLAGPSLACCDAVCLPCAINLYVTAPGKRTSAPPHTDKQDVVVIQTSGRKGWKVFSPPDPALKPTADIFARGKLEDNMPLHSLEAKDPPICELLIDTVLDIGDVMFVPAAFPHTTNTAPRGTDDKPETTSVHLTFGADTHIWELDYLSARRLALRRACVVDSALGQVQNDELRYVGLANGLTPAIRSDAFDALPWGFLEESEESETLESHIAGELKRISTAIDAETASAVDEDVWKDTVQRLRQQGMELFETHRDMYLAAIQEGVTREAEEAMTAHMDQGAPKAMTPERMQRLSLFRVKAYYDKINASKQSLREWSMSGKPSSANDSGPATLPENWAFTLPLKVGDVVEADLGGAFFDATVTRAVGNKYDVQFFDGDTDAGLDRSMIKLKTPPPLDMGDSVDTSKMTAKQLKRWKKEQAKTQK